MAAAAVVMATTVAAAHEFWIEPPGAAHANRPVPLRLFVGDGFPGEPYPRNPRHVTRFELRGPESVTPVEGRTGDDPAGTVTAASPGLYVAVYEGRPTSIELSADKFNLYLEDQGLDDVLRLRRLRGQVELPGRELFSRCAKTLFDMPGAEHRGYDAVDGLRLELVPENDPLALADGEALAIRAVFEGDPLPRLVLRAFRRGGDGPTVSVRTDDTGRARVPIDDAGVWMISGVHMIESGRADADWLSVWSSLTFVLE